MNRQQRRARDKVIKKSKQEKTDIEKKLGLFELIPDDCFVCHKSFDKTDKQMVKTWNVVVRESERSVKVYCPKCWNNALKILNEYGVPTGNERQD